MVKDLVVFLSFKDRTSHQKMMEDDSSRENITYWFTLGVHISDVDDLRGNESRSATSDKQILFLIGVCGQTEITKS